jgi:ABC-2 type transport system permease protein
MVGVRARLTALRYASAAGWADYATMYTWRTWIAGWLTRVLCQVAFFALIGRLLDSPERTHYLLVGNAVLIAAVENCFVCASTTWERRAGTLPLLIAAPVGPLLVFAGRSTFWLASGTATASVALFALAPLFGVGLPWPRALLAVPLIAAVAVATYCFALVLAGFVLRAMETRNVVGNVAHLSIMLLCGVQVPVTFWPAWVQAIASVLPLNHGLAALRALLANGSWVTVGREFALELAVAAGWLLVAALTFHRFAEHGRRDGSIEFGD